MTYRHKDHFVRPNILIVITCQGVILELGPEGCNFLGFPRGLCLPFCLVPFSSEGGATLQLS